MEHLTVWTIQSLRDWRMLRAEGVLRRTEEHRAHIDPPFVDAFEWMREAMRVRMPGYRGAWPIWAWARPRPMLWDNASGWSLGTPLVRMELRVDANRVLLSDFDLWHSVVNRMPACFTKSEWDAWEAHPLYDDMDEVLRASVRATWLRIFDLDACLRAPEWHDGDARLQHIQACIEEVRREDVVHVVPFLGRQWPPAMLRRTP